MRLLSQWIVGVVLATSLMWGCSSNGTSVDPPDPNPPVDTTNTDTTNHLTDEELMDLVQKKTFNYFWDNAEPTSGFALERSNGSSTTVTTGGSGFGLASFPAAIKRGWITRTEAIVRIQSILDFLEFVPTYHGAFSHWYNGATGETQPFSEKDDGGDIVETSYLMQGLLILRQYFDANNNDERAIRTRITSLWEQVDWTWYTQGENVIYWHWSPNYDFQIDQKVTGYNETLIVYVLAASSPTHAISTETYYEGWTHNGNIQNGNKYYGITLPLGPKLGGPLFFAHYSFIGLNPEKLTDRYTNYWEQNVSHTLINYEYCVDNPLGWSGYSEKSWGLTASDDPAGYVAHSPTHDTGVITPTAALSSIPYTPEKSIAAMHYFYEELGDQLWGPYGFYDAYDIQEQWFADGYLAIDEGPIIGMIENYRTGLLWDLFMRDPDVQEGLQKLEFSSPNIESKPAVLIYN